MPGSKRRKGNHDLRFGQAFGRLHDKPRFDFLARPGRFPQEGQAGLHTRIVEETTDWNAPPHFRPAVSLHELFYNRLQCDAVQWIAGMKGWR